MQETEEEADTIEVVEEEEVTSFSSQFQEQSQQNQSNENIRGRRGWSANTQRGRYGARKGSVTCYVCGRQCHYTHQCYHRNQGNNNYASTSKSQDNSEN